MIKNFKQDFYKFRDKIANREPFALSRCNDGEAIIMFDESIDIRNKCNGEFFYIPTEPLHKKYRQQLIDSAQYKGDNYYVGIACRDCIPEDRHFKLKTLTTQDEEHLTWGNIFVNANYPLFQNEILPLFNNFDVILIANYKANPNQLPFKDKIIKKFDVHTNCWMEDQNLLIEVPDYIRENNINGAIILFAAGPFSNILIMECYKQNQNNFLLDIGSTLDPYMNLGYTRGYLVGSETLNKICIW
jgi:hypothetical protein